MGPKPVEREKFMDLRVDWAFKYIFSIKENLMKFLNDILPIEVTDIDYQPNEIQVRNDKDKRSRLDVICESPEGKFLVEMQQRHEDDFDDRLAYYASMLVKNQVKRGKKVKYKINHVYILCVADYVREHTKPAPADKVLFNYYHSETDTKEIYQEGKISYHFLELNRLKDKEWEKLTENPERWCYLFKKMHTFAVTDALPSELHGFDKIVEDAMLEGLSEDNQMDYFNDKGLQEYRIRVTRDAAIKDAMAKGEKNGMKKAARAMLADGMSPELVSKYTGLPMTVISHLGKPK